MSALRTVAIASVARGDTTRLPELADRLAQVAPERGWADLARGAYHVLTGQSVAAVEFLEKAGADPDVETQYALARVWLLAGRTANARRVFETILSQLPTSIRASVGLALCDLAGRKFLEAEARLLKTNSAWPNDPSVLSALRNIYLETGRRKEADLILKSFDF